MLTAEEYTRRQKTLEQIEMWKRALSDLHFSRGQSYNRAQSIERSIDAAEEAIQILEADLRRIGRHRPFIDPILWVSRAIIDRIARWIE